MANDAYNGGARDLPWRLVYLLLGIVVTLMGAWATHSVTREDLAAAMTNRDAVMNQRFQTVEAKQQELADQFRKLDDLRDDMTKVKIALGIDGSRRNGKQQ